MRVGMVRFPRCPGWVTVGWRVEGHLLRQRWQERGGPPLTTPVLRGFGTTLIEQGYQKRGRKRTMSVEGEGLL